MRAFLTAITLLLAGCAANGSGTPTSAGTRTDAAPVLRIVADANANGRRPVAVDVVRVADEATARRLAGLDAAAWFRGRAALRGEAAGRIAIASWEMVPGHSVTLHSLPPFAASPHATMVYALYGTPGMHRHTVEGMQALEIRLGRDGFTVVPLAGGGTP